MKKYLTLIVVILMAMASCSSPESDGEMQAQKECEAYDTYAKNITQVYTNFINGVGNYKTRVEAREALHNSIEEVKKQLQTRLDELNIEYTDLIEKYKDDKDELESMMSAYESIISAYKLDTANVAGLRTQAYNIILTIIPIDPTKTKIQKDLVGRTIRALPGGYLNDNWSWTIESDNIKDLQIIGVEKVDTHHAEILVNMTLQADGAAYKTSGKIYYVLDNRDDWEIDMLEPSEVEVVKTGRYDSSITATFVKYLWGGWIEIHNNSDAALLVGFRIIDNHGKYTKHSLMVGGGETKSYTDSDMVDYSIDFVERP